jgi:general secretion pathway protein D
LESKTFWRAVTPNTIYVATDSKSKRQEIEPQVLKTFYVSNLSSVGTDINDLTNALRTVLEMQRIVAIPSQGALVVRGSADQIALAEKVVNDLDKAKSEVVVDVMVMEVSRDKARNLGISPPFASSNPTVSLQKPNANSTTDSNGNSTTSSLGNLTLNDLANLNATNFAVGIPAANAAFLMNDSTTKVLQNPQVRALDGQKASLKIGNRIPIATGSFGGGLGGIGTGSLLTQTQFQYIDVGVNVDITPHVHANRDVSLKVTLEVSSVTGQSTIGGIQQPIIGQRKMENEIRLKEGEANLLGGIFEETDSVSMSGMPWLSQIPLLKYIFGQQNVTRNHSEIVLVLVPHVVRAQDLTDLNHRTLDIGTQNSIGLRRISQPSTSNPAAPAKPQASPGQPPQAQIVPTPAPQQTAASQPPQSAGDAAKQAGPMGGNAILSFDPPTINQAVGAVFAVNVTLTGGQNVFSVPAQVSYDPKLLQVANVSNGNALSKDGQIVALVHRDDAVAGSVQITATRPPGASGVVPDGVVFTLTFIAKAPGQGTLAINRSVLRDPAMNSMPASGSQAVVTIR